MTLGSVRPRLAPASLVALAALAALLAASDPAARAAEPAQGAGETAPAAGAAAPEEPAPERPPIDGWEGLSCVACHREIAAEWARSAHAHAWTDPAYQEALRAQRRPESCHGCHVPVPLHVAGGLGGKPGPRAAADEPLELGVACAACHLGRGADGEPAMLGPHDVDRDATDAHASERSASFDSLAGRNELCTSCHATTVGPVVGLARDFAAERLGDEGKSCVGCHMPFVERPAAVDPETGPSPARSGRSHLPRGPWDPELLARAFHLEARAEADAVVVTLRNEAGHRVPGLVGRELVLRFTALGPDGGPLPGADGGTASAELRFDARHAFPVRGSRELRLPAGAARVRAEGLHLAPGAAAAVPFLEEELVP